MQRAPWPVSLLFGLALALLTTLVGPLLLFNPAFTSVLQERHDVAEAFGTSQSEVGRVTGEILGDLYTDGAFDASFDGDPPLLNERERSHMHDVAVLVRLLAGAVVLALIVAAITGVWLRAEPRRLGRVMVLAAASIGAVAVLLALVFAVAFEPAFLAFHTLFFPPGTYLFEADSNLITLFPQGFWFDASLAAGATIVLAALIVSAIGLWRRRAPAATVEAA